MGIAAIHRTCPRLAGLVASRKSQGLLRWRGVAERALFQLLDIDPRVEAIVSGVYACEPDGDPIHTFPALINESGQSTFVAIVPEGPLCPGWKETCRRMEGAGLAYKLVSKEVLLSSAVATNLSRLRRVRRSPPSIRAVERLEEYDGIWPAKFADLSRHLGSDRDVDALLVFRYLCADVWKALTPDSLLGWGM